MILENDHYPACMLGYRLLLWIYFGTTGLYGGSTHLFRKKKFPL